MTPILSVVLPVHDRESSLARQVQQLLDFLPELTAHFELIVVDNGSQDQTGELASEMSRQYPQVRVVTLAEQQSMPMAAKQGITRSSGEVVLVQEEDTPIRTADYRKLWALRSDKSLVMARSTTPQPAAKPAAMDGKVIDRLVEWGHAMRSAAAEHQGPGGVQMIRRSAVEQLSDIDAANDELVVEYGDELIAEKPQPIAASQVRPRRPLVNFLQHLRGFAPAQ
ncbi:glycosyl transferase family 2 [Pirellula staleyi DSM 6068]|uniref:Glycosyl transferase family 2 n=1 Tax=Pirellula staleyi (strain ATCC 27377 / DSM 6068 / ICPB 4128) TaxID=530564 RepID=D2R0U6_PIRSD|nr:glycosyltransferase [Pirellula staleyi]ADB16694.1 glycosyl transferase family 2 [Pirellula staleyi DSM 6068]